MEIKDFTVNITVNSNYSLKKFLGLPEVPCQRDTESPLTGQRATDHCCAEILVLRVTIRIINILDQF